MTAKASASPERAHEAPARPSPEPAAGTIGWLLRFARPATARLAVSAVARLLGHALGALLIALPAWAVGALATGSAEGAGFVLVVLLVFVLAAVLKAGLRYLEQLFGHLAAFGLMGEMRVWMIDRLIPQAPAVTDGSGAARIQATAVRDVDRVEVFFAHTIAPAVSAVVIPLAAVGVAWAAAGPLPAAALAVVLLIGVLLPLAGARAGREAARETARTRSDLAQFVADSVRLREEVLASEAEGTRLDGAARLDQRLGSALRRGGTRAGLRSGVNALRLWAGTLAVLLAGAPAVLADATALPWALAAAALVPGTATSLDTIERLAGSLPAGLEATRRIRALAAGRPSVTEPARATSAAESATPTAAEPADVPAADDGAASGEPGAATAPDEPGGEPAGAEPEETAAADGSGDVSAAAPSDGLSAEAPADGDAPALELERIRFAYPGREELVIDGVDLAVPRGGVVGIAGASGSGKSTIARLVQRHWDVDGGRVRVHGTPVEELGSDETARLIAVADQDPFVLDATVAENLRLGAPEATDAELAEAMRLAELDLPLDRPAGRRGNRLSGGQRQRLALARTLLRAAQAPGGPARAVLVLDEATSHQDPLTQARIVERLREVDATVIVIAHRLEVLRDADRILVLERGRVVEEGDWERLSTGDGPFARLLATQ
ncbi:ABC transporter ATP-binding protein [Gulosibacter sp. 10]|uniref:ABC transporter ATP-binding protein n=1 Tax=Gulosibacter sp. 10 TaxID=1255570 RepID=UPI00097EBA2D|nr:ABC transporter ATP-binding protein [Gulosibacter sp. 10]SJM60399.1 putative ABC transporter ATP-binding protein [Gulosibacter sp. 10]